MEDRSEMTQEELAANCQKYIEQFGGRMECMLAMQKELNDFIIRRRNLQCFTTTDWIKNYSLALSSELAEVLDEANFKWWKNPQPIDFDKLKEEIVDVFHFFLSLVLVSGMDASELFQLYMKKNLVNFQRQTGNSQYNIEQEAK